MQNRTTADLAYSGRIRDARGREIRVIKPVRMRLLHRYGVIEREALDQIVEDIVPGFRRNLWLAIIVLTATVVLTVGGIVPDCLREGPTAWQDLLSTLKIMWPMFIAALVGGVVAPWIAVRKQNIRRTIAALYKHQRCLHCGYDLRDLPTSEADGATTCPECACAWRFDEENEGDLAGEAGVSRQRPFGVAVVVLIIIGLALLAILGAVLLLFR